jgi:hypothetical protein
MNSPPRPAFPTAPTGNAQELPPSPEDDLLAVRGPGLPPGLSPLTLPEAISTRDISPDPIPLTPLVESGSLHPSVQIQEPLSHEHRLQASQSTSPNAASLEPARHSPSPPPPPPDELIYTMSQYQPVSAGSSANSRAMSQVSPGFIFVNFLSQSVCCFFSPCLYLARSTSSLVLSVSCLLSHVSFVSGAYSSRTQSIVGATTNQHLRTTKTNSYILCGHTK